MNPIGLPLEPGISIGDTLAATFACVGCLVALHHQVENTGKGQIVDSALYEATLGGDGVADPRVHADVGYVRPRTGSILPNVAPANAYPTKDGKEHLISGNQDTVWKPARRGDGSPRAR